MDIPPYLSGNFSELRSNHFHSGIDFKTEGRIGIPVRAVKDGYISRIYIAPSGFGRALYINHPDGTMTVYGHLDRFADKIESFARDSQYAKESFSVDLTLIPSLFPVKQGDVVALSGNAGSSGGPHLHFEIRNAEGNEIRDPLPVYKKLIRDTQSPEIRSLMFFPQPGSGVVNGKTQDQVVLIAKDKDSKQVLNKSVSAWGKIGIGVKSYDRMTGTSNIYGTKEIILKMDDRVVFHSIVDRFSFAESRYVNSFICWEDWVNNNSFHVKSFVDPGNQLDVYRMDGNGIVTIDKERKYEFEYTLIDAFENKMVFQFDVVGRKQTIPAFQSSGKLFSYNRDNAFSGSGIDLKIPQGNLYKNLYFRLDTIKDYTPFGPLYRLREKVALHTPCPLSLRIVNDNYSDPSKYGVVAVHKNVQTWLGGTYEKGKMNLTIKDLGDFAVVVDTVAPVITPINPNSWTNAGKISFTIKDNLSGIGSFRGTLDGKFVLFEFDAKNRALSCTYDSKRMKKGNRELVLTVTDNVGNLTIYKRQVVL